MRHTIAKEAAMRTTAAAFVLLLALPALAAEEPDAAYARFHRAVVTGDVDEVLSHGGSQLRTDLSGLSPAQRDAELKMLAASMPRAFTVRQKNVARDGKSAQLLLSGPGGSVLDAKSETLYGSVRMLLERGGWKVAVAKWDNQPPAGLQPAGAAAQKSAAQRPAAAAPASAPKPVAQPRGAPLVGSVNATPERKLGVTKEPCVYKPVMTAEDIENCR
jgi:hypothetical protein